MLERTINLPLFTLILLVVLLLIVGAALNYWFSVRKLKQQIHTTEQELLEKTQDQALGANQLKQHRQQLEVLQNSAEEYERKWTEQTLLRQSLAEKQAGAVQQIENLLHNNSILTQKNTELEQLSSDFQQKYNQSEKHLAEVKIQLEDEKIISEEKLHLLQKSREQMSQEFRDLASNVMKQNSEQFNKQHQQSLTSVLDPFKEQLGEFRKRVDLIYDTESRDRVSLLKEINGLRDLNQKITEEASNLTKALKGDRKAQGNWGEVILERVLEASGLQNGREYETQKHLKDEDGSRFLPDVVIHLPDKKDVIIDSKVSLSAYERYFSSEDESIRERCLKEHLAAIRKHVDDLSNKNYADLEGVNTLDFVFIFIPIEPAYLLAIQEDPNLLTDAFLRKIIIVSPTTLLATLRIIENVWRFELQSKNAVEIARQAGRLYDKFVNFIIDLDNVEKDIEKSLKNLGAAKIKLHSGKGNLVSSTEKLRLLGAKTSKQLNNKLLEQYDDE